MCDDEDDELCRYFFGELSDAEKAAFEGRLKNEPDLAERFQRFSDCVAAHGGAEGCPEAKGEEPPIPRHLADRTAHAILAGHFERASECVGRKRFNLAEVIAVGVAATFLGGLILPAIEASRESSRRDQCAFNLANLGKGLWGYSEDHGHLPQIGLTQNAGLFTVLLAEGGYLDRDLLQKSIVCPSSDLSKLIADGELKVFIPTSERLKAASADQLLELQRLMAGSYAYRIGYFQGRDFVPFGGGVSSGCRSAILADSPSLTSVAEIVSRHHGKCGQNVLFEDGHVAFVTGCWAPDDVDHLYLNDDSQLAAGSNAGDIVLAPSDITPLGVQLIELGE
jgi:hypothetical protein